MSYNIAQRRNVQRVQDRSRDRSLWNSKLKVFDIIFYTINHHELFSVVEVGFKPFQDLFSETKAIVQSIQEKSVINKMFSSKNVAMISTKLKFNRYTKFSNLSSEEWSALKSLKKRKDIVIKAADKGGAVVVWRADLYQKEALRQLSDTSFYAKVDKDLTLINQNIIKNTINDLIAKQELPATAKNLIITTPRTSCIYFLPKIHKPNNPGRPIVSACSCPTELTSSYLDKIMAPIVKT